MEGRAGLVIGEGLVIDGGLTSSIVAPPGVAH